MLILSNEQIETLVSMEECINALEQVYHDLAEGKALISPRVDNLAPCSHARAYYGFKHMGGTWPRRGIQALRINSDIVSHPTQDGVPRRSKVPLANGRWVGLVELFSTETGELLAIFPDGVVQHLRVGATNGLGIKYLARSESSRLGLIGAGWQAQTQLMAALTVRPITDVKVYSQRKESRQAFVREAAEKYDVNIRAVETPEECVEDVDIIMAGTSSLRPVVRAEWLRPGMHISCIKTQEFDAAVLARCDKIVVHTKQQVKQIDNIMPGTPHVIKEHLEGWWNQPGTRWEDFQDLADLIGRGVPRRSSAQEITCFINNVGSGLQFAAVGAVVLAKAHELGIGHDLPGEWFTESVHP